MMVRDLRQRLAGFRRQVIDLPGGARAAVSLTLREDANGASLLVIHRSERQNDPWSGHLGLPGGRQHDADASLEATVARETQEEVGLDLERRAVLLGALDDLQAIGHGRALDLVITPFVHLLEQPIREMVLDRREVQDAFWVPLAHLQDEAARGTLRHEIEGMTLEHPAFLFRQHKIWGLTYQIVSQLLEIGARGRHSR